MLWPGVGPFVPSRCSIVTVECVDLVFSTEASIGLSYIMFDGNSGMSRNKSTSLWNIVTNLADYLFVTQVLRT